MRVSEEVIEKAFKSVYERMAKVIEGWSSCALVTQELNKNEMIETGKRYENTYLYCHSVILELVRDTLDLDQIENRLRMLDNLIDDAHKAYCKVVRNIAYKGGDNAK